ncbi:MAG: ABC transporter ATP-binding protein [Candidatus Magasanikbacteria bacterium]|nr:ABC transporter ATP-binding protein [Candidatus Magasanikbacteria bacterium]
MSALIDLKDIKKAYQADGIELQVLKGITFQIQRGEFVAIMGPSGSGKSTLMHILSFLDTISDGKYFFDGKDASHFEDESLAQMRNERVGFVFQSFNLLPRTTVRENVRLPLQYRTVPVTNENEMVQKAIESVGLSHRADHLSNQLSGGEKQRVAIARALVNEPDIIFADEPTGNLDSVSGGQILQILQLLNESGHTIIMVTHEQDTALHAARILSIKDGKLLSDTQNTHRRSAKDSVLQK